MIEPNIPKEFLVVDDSATIRSFLKKYLKMAFKDCKVHEAKNGKEAIKELTQNKVHLIITDLNMPEFSGEEFINTITNNRLLSKKPIIVLSSEETTELKEKFKNKSNIIFLPKPSSQEEIIIQIKNLLNMN